MIKSVLAIDPGQATGISLWRVPDHEPIERIHFELIKFGLDGFVDWWRYSKPDGYDSALVIEEFIQDGRTPRVDTNALEIQGLVKGTWDLHFDEIHIHRNSKKTIVGDKLLKQHGFWLKGSDVGWGDGRDVNDSQLHALAWAKVHHRPSQEYFWPR